MNKDKNLSSIQIYVERSTHITTGQNELSNVVLSNRQVYDPMNRFGMKIFDESDNRRILFNSGHGNQLSRKITKLYISSTPGNMPIRF